MRADRERDRQALATGYAGRIDALEIGRGGHVSAGLVPVAQAQATAPDIPPAGCRIDRVIDGRTEIAATVVGVLRVKGELCQIDVLARDLDLMHRSFIGWHLYHRLGVGEPPEIFVVKLVLASFERGSQTPSAARGLGDDLHLFGACFFEQERFLGSFDDRAQARQRHRLVVNLDLTHVDEPLDEAAQPVLFHIDVGRERLRDVHCPNSACIGSRLNPLIVITCAPAAAFGSRN
jgi:hypothetical protein